MLKGMKNKTLLFIPLLVFLGNSLLFSQEESVSVRDAALATGLAWIISPMDGQNNILRYAGGGGVHIQSSNPPRFYNFGYGALAKTGFSLGNSFWGTLYGEVSADFLLPFLGSEVKGARCKRNFMVEAKAGSLGISDNFTYKADRYRSEPDTVQVFNSFDVYAKVWFIR